MRKKEELRAYQIKGVKHIENNPKNGLFLDMGLGKTATTLTAFSNLQESLEASKALIIAPKRVAESVWSDEVGEWRHLRHLKVVPISGSPDQRIKKLKIDADIHTISIDNAQWLAGYRGSFSDYDMVIIDESSMFKNNNTKRFKVLKKVLKDVPRVTILTGTPTPNSLVELWSQIFLLDGGERLYPHITKFRSVFTDANYNGWGYTVKEGYDKHILKLIGDICLSMRAKDYGFEVPVVENTVKCYLGSKEQRRYDDFKRDLILDFIEENEDEDGGYTVTAVNAAVLSNKLMQFANGAIYDADKNVIPIHDEKLSALESILNETNTPVLVTYSYEFDKERILKLVKSIGKRGEVFTKTEQIYRWNSREIDVLIMHPKSGGHGLNLQKGGHTIVWFGSTFSLESEQQLNARLARSGQDETVVIHKLVCMNTIEEDIMPKMNRKRSTQEAVMEYLKDFKKNKV